MTAHRYANAVLPSSRPQSKHWRGQHVSDPGNPSKYVDDRLENQDRLTLSGSSVKP
jgi:hypothetical protein